jgi:hypothetical protein
VTADLDQHVGLRDVQAVVPNLHMPEQTHTLEGAASHTRVDRHARAVWCQCRGAVSGGHR